MFSKKTGKKKHSIGEPKPTEVAKAEESPTPIQSTASKSNNHNRFHNWLINNNLILSAYASIVTIVSALAIIVGLIIGLQQIKDMLTLPEIDLEFVHPTLISYNVVNSSNKIAESIEVDYGIIDLDDTPPKLLPINADTYEWVNEHSSRGPFGHISNFVQSKHRYFGIVYVSGKGIGLKTYWLYVNRDVPKDSFYAKRYAKDTLQIILDPNVVTEKYIEQLVPRERRLSIRD